MEPIPLADIPPANPDAREDVQPITSASTTGEELPQPKTPFDKGGAEAKDTCDLDKKSAGGGIGKNFTPVNKGGAEVEKDTCDIDKSGGGIGKNFTPVNKGGAEEKDTVNVVATQRIMVQKPWLPLTDAFTRHVSRNSKHF
jgi:hypothetical protein